MNAAYKYTKNARFKAVLDEIYWSECSDLNSIEVEMNRREASHESSTVDREGQESREEGGATMARSKIEEG